MGKYSVKEIFFKESPQVTNEGRLKIALPSQVFQSRFRYNSSDLLWDTVDNTNGTISHEDNIDGIKYSIPQASGDKIVRQTFKYFAHQPGNQTAVRAGALFEPAKTNLRQRVGQFDANNGVFLELEDSTLNWVRRTAASGSAVDNEVAQASWNIDTMDGGKDEDNPSGLTLDMTKFQMLVIDYSWYGGGPIKVGFQIDGQVHYVHEFSGANSLTEPILGNANLPVRHEIENTGATDSSSELKIFGGSVFTDGHENNLSDYSFAASNEGTAVSVNAATPVLSIRPKTTFNSQSNRGEIIPQVVDVFNNGQEPVFYQIIFNGSLTGASFSSVDDDSITEFDTSASAISGGKIIASGYVPTSSNNKAATDDKFVNSRIGLTVDAAGANPRPLTLVARTVTGNASDVYGVFNFSEVY